MMCVLLALTALVASDLTGGAPRWEHRPAPLGGDFISETAATTDVCAPADGIAKLETEKNCQHMAKTPPPAPMPAVETRHTPLDHAHQRLYSRATSEDNGTDIDGATLVHPDTGTEDQRTPAPYRAQRRTTHTETPAPITHADTNAGGRTRPRRGPSCGDTDTTPSGYDHLKQDLRGFRLLQDDQDCRKGCDARRPSARLQLRRHTRDSGYLRVHTQPAHWHERIATYPRAENRTRGGLATDAASETRSRSPWSAPRAPAANATERPRRRMEVCADNNTPATAADARPRATHSPILRAPRATPHPTPRQARARSRREQSANARPIGTVGDGIRGMGRAVDDGQQGGGSGRTRDDDQRGAKAGTKTRSGPPHWDERCRRTCKPYLNHAIETIAIARERSAHKTRALRSRARSNCSHEYVLLEHQLAQQSQSCTVTTI